MGRNNNKITLYELEATGKKINFQNPDNHPNLKFEFNNHFLNLCYKELENNKYNWVDMEQIYFNELVSIGKMRSTKEFHNQVNEIINTLPQFLTEETNKPLNLIEKISDYFNSESNKTIISFNYTNKESLYNKNFNEIIHIHGLLDNPIFGYSDENEITKNLNDMKDKSDFIECSKQIKCNENIKKIKKIIDYSEYEVMIIGHSCGESDRSLLNEIFENKNCLSIKTFIYNENEMKEKLKNIRLCFTNYENLRKFNNTDFMLYV
jgi:hypothetical protein